MKHNIESKLKVLDNCAILSDVPKHVELLKLTMLFFFKIKNALAFILFQLVFPPS